MGKESVTSKRKLLRKIRQRKVWNLRVKGLRQKDIAEQLGISHDTVCHDLKFAYEEYVKLYQEDAIKASILDRERIDELIKAHWDNATSGDDVHSANMVLKLLIQRERIFGYGQPLKFKQVDANKDANVLVDILKRLETPPNQVEITTN